MTYTIVVCREGKEDLVFKGVIYFLAEPKRVKMLRERWITVEEVTGLILHEEQADE